MIEWVDEISYYVFHTRALGYIHGDIVEYQVTRPSKDGKLAEARPTRLIKRSEDELLMEVRVIHGKIAYKILPGLGGLIVRPEKAPAVIRDGDLFIVRCLENKIVEILRYFGSEKDPKIQEEIIFWRAWVRLDWSEKIKNLKVPLSPQLPKAEAFDFSISSGSRIPSSTKLADTILFPRVLWDEGKRFDFRSWPTMTIDGADAKDLDDAISIATYENGDFLLAVHIADVAEYVEESSELDREAYLRGTSIYTPGRVIPMLPEILSNDRCSLHPGSPKLTLSILLRVDPSWQVKESFVTESVIESEKKWVYEDIWQELQQYTVQSAHKGMKQKQWDEQEFRSSVIARLEPAPLQNGEAIQGSEIQSTGSPHSASLHSRWHEKGHSHSLSHFHSLYKILESRRKKEGKILFETTECYFDLDEERNVKNIRKRTRNEAHMMIEEFMVLANEEIAKWCAKQKIPFLSRVHDLPGGEQMKAIAEILENPALSSHLEPRDIEKALSSMLDPTTHYRLSRLLLPKMAKAAYREKMDRHFGLALSYYAHFTSPIRRYPDLLLHRMIKKHLHGELSKEKSIYEKNMKKWGLSLSEKERSAEEVSRAVDDLYMCRYMSDKVGQIFDGVISWLTESNIYVELESGVEGSIYLGVPRPPFEGGMAKASGVLPAYISKWKSTLDPIRWALVDHTWKILSQIGQSIRVRVREVDMVSRRIEMEISPR